MPWTDSHCHIPFDAGDGKTVDASVIADARDAGVTRLVTIGTDAPSSQAVLEVARAHVGVWATVGLHPHDAVEGAATLAPLLAERDPNVVGVGECGLDYHYDHSPRDVQQRAFAAQIGFAHEYGLALVIHTREAWDDTFAVLAEAGVPERTVFHCFTGGAAEARRALDIGAALSFSGIVTFPKSTDVQDAARLCPLDRLLVETDTPYLAPVPHRGRPNRPALVPVVGAAVAALRGQPVEEVEEATWRTAETWFGLTPGEGLP